MTKSHLKTIRPYVNWDDYDFVGVMEVKPKIVKLLKQVRLNHRPVLIFSDRKPIAALVGIERLRELEAAERQLKDG